MPRLHLGERGRRAGSTARGASSRRSSSSGSSKNNSNDALHSEFDQFDCDNDFGDGDSGAIVKTNSGSTIDDIFGGGGGGGGGVGGSSSPSTAAALSKTQKSSSLPPKQKQQQRRRSKALFDSPDDGSSTDSSSSLLSSSSDDEPIPSKRPAAVPKKKQQPPRKPPTAAGKKKANNGSVCGTTRRMRPTVTSPKITLARLANEKTACKSKKKTTQPSPAGKKQPMGKPIHRVSSGAGNRNDENTENYQRRPQSKGKRKKAPSSAGNTRAVSFAKNTKKKGGGGAAASSSPLNSDDDASSASDYGGATKKTKRGGSSKKGNTKSKRNPKSRNSSPCVVDCLFDTDDENGGDKSSSSEDDDDDDEVFIVEAEKETAKHNKKKKQPRRALAGTNYRGARDERRRPVQVLPLRGLAVDNRAVPTVTGDSMARHSFLGYIANFLEGGLTNGVLVPSACSDTAAAAGGGNTATIVASLVHGAKSMQEAGAVTRGKKSGGRASVSGGRNKGSAGALAQTAVVPRVSYLFDSQERESAASSAAVTVSSKEERVAWMAELLTPINSGFYCGRGEFDDIYSSVGAGDCTGATGFDYGLDTTSRPSGSISNAACNNEQNERCRRVPDGFTAGDSWSYFADLVEAIDYKLSSSSDDSNPGHAARRRPVTLFTTDANLFAENQSPAHIRGLEQFWKRIHTKHIHTSSLTPPQTTSKVTAVIAITIMIVETTSMMQTMRTIKNSYHNDSYSDDPGTTMDDHNGSMADVASSHAFDSSAIPNRLHVIQCVNDIRRRIRELHRVQQEIGLEPSAPSMMTMPTINVQLEFMEGNAISFQSLLQTWVKESFIQTYASTCNASTLGSGDGGVQGRLSFDLPETLDGCSICISLDLQYTTLPHGIASPATQRLVEEMRSISLLSPSSVEVLQTIPLSSVDSSLIYGVPMSARAGLENDISRYNEMQMLARQLWKFLSRADAGLVLRVRSGSNNNEDSSSGVRQSSSSGGNGEEEELFLLVCEEAVQASQPSSHNALLDQNDSNHLPDPSEAMDVVPDKRHSRLGKAPSHGMLYRYATKSQILCFENEEKATSGEDDENLTEISSQYFDYIERSLETLVKTGVNPLLM